VAVDAQVDSIAAFAARRRSREHVLIQTDRSGCKKWKRGEEHSKENK
jgi:hypothetical protein